MISHLKEKKNTASSYNLRLNIADIPVTIKSLSDIEEIGLSDRIMQFSAIGENNEQPLEIHLETVDSLDENYGDLIYDPSDIWKMFRNGEIFNAAVYYDNTAPIGVISSDSEWKNISVRIKKSDFTRDSIIHLSGLELIIRAAIQFRKGAIFHSSGVDDNGKGILFIGHSGEGKSTQSRLWQGLEGTMIFNEDRNAVREINNKIFCFGTPWGGTSNIANNHKVPLEAIIMIEKAGYNKIEKLSSTEVIPRLIARSFFPYWDKNLTFLAISNITAIALKVPVYKLSCKPGPEVVNLVRSVL